MISPGELVVPEPQDQFRSGGENTGLSAVDFWTWNMGDLRMNTTRGFLAEFLVARAVGDPAPLRVEWGAFDICAADGTRIEMKASGYAQSWPGKKASVSFKFDTVHKTKGWDEHLGKDIEVDPRDRVHVWVFALQGTPRDAETYDPMDLDSWSFRVVPHAWLRTCGQESGAPSFFDKHGFQPVELAELPEAVRAARRLHEEILENSAK
ncbi:MAG: hypothetical protein IPK93_02460 [Solirubrobacterales bacterium]|nr:hypothetical protein [Solirubrobacterales bacterium]